MTENIDVWLAFAGAIAVLGIGMWKNRSDINELKTAIFGHEREDNGGHEAEIDTLADQLDRIETKLDNEREKRIEDHKDVEIEVRETRYMIARSVASLVREINSESADIEIEVPDVEPPEELDD